MTTAKKSVICVKAKVAFRSIQMGQDFSFPCTWKSEPSVQAFFGGSSLSPFHEATLRDRNSTIEGSCRWDTILKKTERERIQAWDLDKISYNDLKNWCKENWAQRADTCVLNLSNVFWPLWRLLNVELISCFCLKQYEQLRDKFLIRKKSYGYE